MKSKAKWLLGLGLGFLAGVVFVISCGQEARSTAEEILKAIGITFDPTGTDLAAQNLQDLGTELDTRIVALETKIGTPANPDTDLSGRVTALETRMTNIETMLVQVQGIVIQIASIVATPSPNSLILECLEKELASYQVPADWVVLDSQTHVNGSVTLSLPCSMSLRYLKIEATYTSDMGQVNIYEIQAFGPDAPTTNLALNKTATAISSQGGDAGGQGPRMAVDGNVGSRWASERGSPGPASVAVPHWIMVDLGQNYQVNQIVINSGNYNEDYTLLGKRGE
jgi:hypothetical protein